LPAPCISKVDAATAGAFAVAARAAFKRSVCTSWNVIPMEDGSFPPVRKSGCHEGASGFCTKLLAITGSGFFSSITIQPFMAVSSSAPLLVEGQPADELDEEPSGDAEYDASMHAAGGEEVIASPFETSVSDCEDVAASVVEDEAADADTSGESA